MNLRPGLVTNCPWTTVRWPGTLEAAEPTRSRSRRDQETGRSTALLSAKERGELRDQAIASWVRAKALNEAAGLLISDARTLRSDARASRTVRLNTDRAAVLRVDQILEARSHEERLRADGVGFVLASRITRIGALHEGLHRRLPLVWTAGEPASALGITIMNQPDIALVDDDLPILTGMDAVRLLGAFAPETRFVLFSSDEKTVREANQAGIPTSSVDLSVDEIVSVIDETLAA